MLPEVAVDEPSADGLFLVGVGVGVTGTTGSGAGVEDDSGATGGVEAGVYVLQPAPVGGGLAGESGCGREAVEFVVENIAEAFGEDEREDVVLVFWRVPGPARVVICSLVH